METYGTALKRQRELCGYTQTELSKETKITQ